METDSWATLNVISLIVIITENNVIIACPARIR